MTPYYNKDGITIYCGDNAEVMAELDAGSIDLTVTSPPYDNLRTYNGYSWDFPAIAGQLWRVTAQGGVVVWVVGDATVNGSETGTSFRQALHFMGLGFNLHDTMIFDKNSFRYPFPDKYHQVFEYMFVLSAGTPKTINLINDRKVEWKDNRDFYTKREIDGTFTKRNGVKSKDFGKRYNIWRYAIGGNNCTPDDVAYSHPAIFPEALACDHIISWSNEGDLVCDPFLGSGTTAKMAQQLGRRFVGCDISEEYCKIAIDRLRQPSFFSLPTFQPKVQPEQLSMEAL